MRDVFVSRPSTMTAHQQGFCEAFTSQLANRGFRSRTIGATDYPSVAPIEAVRKLMSECHGAAILGLKQIHIINGIAKEGTAGVEQLTEYFLPTAWNQIEAGMAFALKLPVIVIREEKVNEGVFDIGSSDLYIHKVTLPGEDWLNSEAFLQPFNQWIEDIIKN